MFKQTKAYLKAHPTYNSFIHLVLGMGIGALLVFPLFLPHQVRWGIGLIAVGLLGHLYPTMAKK